MDLASVIGIASGFGLLLLSILMGGGIATFINVPSMMIVIGGTAAATLINYPLSDFLGVMKVVKNAFLNKTASPEDTIRTLVGFAEKARRDGLLALEKDLKVADDAFLRAGMELAIDGMDLERIDALMTMELTLLADRHSRGSGMFKQMAKYAPAFGMMGTLIGLIQMLRNVNDPSSIGPGMAVALITTFYGTLVANMICNPIAGKLDAISENEVLVKELILEGIKAIQAGDNPRLVERKLKTFLPPAIRNDLKLIGSS
ncbi:MAG: MotA/TolQ/ExbB proton channel family protein [Candidatus Eisenbacteria bacterium]|nr:MotA/TolQ/ExbB proton channel family protein [Candidatus Eisenbacteria bacterium]